jgi:hypothetical protein
LGKFDCMHALVGLYPLLPEDRRRATTGSTTLRDLISGRSQLTLLRQVISSSRQPVRCSAAVPGSAPDFSGPAKIPMAGPHLDLTVVPASVDRAMLILDALIKGLELRSFRVVTPPGDAAGSWVELHGESVRHRLDERVDRIARPLDESKMDRVSWILGPRVEYVNLPGGELSLHIIHLGRTIFHAWRDDAKKRLEEWLNSFVVGLIRVALGMEDERREAERQRLEAERRRTAWEEAEQRRKEQERLRREEEEWVRQLGTSLDAWVSVRNLRAMIAEVRERASRLGREIPPDSCLGRWLELAERTAARMDPLRELLSVLRATVEGASASLESPSA